MLENKIFKISDLCNGCQERVRGRKYLDGLLCSKCEEKVFDGFSEPIERESFVFTQWKKKKRVGRTKKEPPCFVRKMTFEERKKYNCPVFENNYYSLNGKATKLCR